MHVYYTAYWKNLRRTTAITCILAASAVIAFCLKRYSEHIPLAAVPLAVFSFVHGLFLSELVKARRRFEARGDAEVNESQFDDEFRSEDVLRFDHLHFTANWLFCDKPSTTFLMPMAEVVWMYKMTENNTHPHLVIHFQNDDKFETALEASQIEAILHCSTARYPHIVIGYSKELAAVSDTDRKAFRKQLADAPRVLVDNSSPFVDPYYQTVVYAKVEGKKRKCLLALTREARLVLIRGESVVFDRAAAEIDSARSWWFGRLTVRFGHPGWDACTVTTYSVHRWLSLLRKAKRGAPLGGYEKHGYSDPDSHNFTASRNGYYLPFLAAFFSLLFFGVVHFAMWSGDDSLWDEGIGMGIATYFLLPICLPPIMLYAYIYLKGLQGAQMFPTWKEEE